MPKHPIDPAELRRCFTILATFEHGATIPQLALACGLTYNKTVNRVVSFENHGLLCYQIGERVFAWCAVETVNTVYDLVEV